MFEEDIAHANDMIRRLEMEVGLSRAEVEGLPGHLRVPTREAAAWRQVIEEKIRTGFAPEALARYRVAWDLYKEELERGEGNETTRILNAWRRIVSFLTELDQRPKDPSGD